MLNIVNRALKWFFGIFFVIILSKQKLILMKKFGSLVFVSLLSGALTLGAYKFFLEPNKAGKLTLASPNYAKNVNFCSH